MIAFMASALFKLLRMMMHGQFHSLQKYFNERDMNIHYDNSIGNCSLYLKHKRQVDFDHLPLFLQN